MGIVNKNRQNLRIHLLNDEAARTVGAADVSVLWVRPVWPPRVEAVVVSGRVPTRP